MKTQVFAAGLASAALVAGSALALPGIASAGTTHRAQASFGKAQARLEQQLAYRAADLQRLTADVAGAKTLTPAHAATLGARLGTESASIAALGARVPGDTTLAQLRADRAAMLKDNRVYAVMTPQVFETIEADAVAAQVASLQANEASLQSSVTALSGQPGYHTALVHYNWYVKAVDHAAAVSANVTAAVLVQTPQDFPRDTHVFVRSNRALLDADLALAHATYDASVVGLASGGYTGS